MQEIARIRTFYLESVQTLIINLECKKKYWKITFFPSVDNSAALKL